MGVEAGSIGSFYVRQADGEYKRICKVEDAKFITIDRDDGPREHVCIFEPNETMTFSINDWQPWDKQMPGEKRKGYKKRMNRLCKTVFGMTEVEIKFTKKKKRSRKRIRKAFARFTTPIMKETHKQNK